TMGAAGAVNLNADAVFTGVVTNTAGGTISFDGNGAQGITTANPTLRDLGQFTTATGGTKTFDSLNTTSGLLSSVGATTDVAVTGALNIGGTAIVSIVAGANDPALVVGGATTIAA